MGQQDYAIAALLAYGKDSGYKLVPHKSRKYKVIEHSGYLVYGKFFFIDNAGNTRVGASIKDSCAVSKGTWQMIAAKLAAQD